MSKRYLEDIVEEERGLQTISFVDKLKEFPNNLVLEHPFLTSATAFLAGHYTLNYLQINYPQYTTSVDYDAMAFSIYTTYTILGLFKEYVLERRSPKLKNKGLYKWFLENSKIAGLFGAIAGAYLCYEGEHTTQSLFTQKDTLKLANRIVAGALLGGGLTEIISRGLKNLARIKKSVRKLKTNTIEKLWNIPFEHPFVASAVATIATFNIVYNHPASRTIPFGTGSGRAIILKGKLLEDIVENPGRIGDLFLQSCIVGAATLGGVLAAGSVFHSHSLRELGLRTAKLYNDFISRKDKAIDYQKKLLELPNSIEKTIENLVELGNLYYENNDRNNAFRCYRKAVRLFTKKQDYVSYSDFFRKTLKLDKIARKIKTWFYKKDDEKSDINRIFIDLLNKDERALSRLRDLAEEGNPEYVYIYGKALEIFGYKESGRLQKEFAIRKIKPKVIEEPGTKNTILRLEHEVFKAEVIGKHSSLDNLLREQEATKQLRRILEQHENYDAPAPIGVIDGNYYMEQISGDTLEKVIEGNREQAVDYIKRTARFLGLIHATLKPTGQPRQYEEKIKKRLIDCSINRDLIKKIVDNIYPVIDNLKRIDIVVNKDAHPGNWIIDEFNDITSIDLELDGVIPITIDTAKLLSWYKISDEEKRKVLKEHLDSFNKYCGKKPLKVDYEFALFSSIIVRSLMLYSSPRHSEEIAKTSLNNALDAIDSIRQEFPREYKRDETAYQNLFQAIEELRST